MNWSIGKLRRLRDIQPSFIMVDFLMVSAAPRDFRWPSRLSQAVYQRLATRWAAWARRWRTVGSASVPKAS